MGYNKNGNTPVGWPFEQLMDSKQTVKGVNGDSAGDDRWCQLFSAPLSAL